MMVPRARYKKGYMEVRDPSVKIRAAITRVSYVNFNWDI